MQDLENDGSNRGALFMLSAKAVRYLGIYIDSDISMTAHVTKILGPICLLQRAASAQKHLPITFILFSSFVSASLVLSRLGHRNATQAFRCTCFHGPVSAATLMYSDCVAEEALAMILGVSELVEFNAPPDTI